MMESTIKYEQGAEQEAVGLQRTVTSTCRGTRETDLRGLSDEAIMESDSELLQPPTLEVLTNEIINTGTQASASPCSRASSPGSHNVSPSNDNTQGTRDPTFPGELESSNAVIETAAEERHVDDETRPLKEENKTHFKELETSSDDTDDWETASEKSFAFDAEPHDPHRVKEETGSSGPEKHNEDSGFRGPKPISEDAVPHGQEIVTEEAGLHSHEMVKKNTGLHSQDTVSKKVGHHGHETSIEDSESHDQEMVSDDTGLHSQETSIEDSESHGQETASEDAGPRSQEMLTEEDEPHSHEMSEDAGPRGLETVSVDVESHGFAMLREEVGHGTASKNVETHGHDTISKTAQPHGYQTASEEAEPPDQETISEEDELHGLDLVSEEAVPFSLEMSGEEAEPLSHNDMETDNEGATLHSQDTSDDDTRSYGQETVNKEMVSEETESYSKETGALVHETVSDLTNPNIETVVELVRLSDNETVEDLTRPPNSPADAELQDNETVSGVENEEFDEDCEISLHKDNRSAVSDQAVNEITVTRNEESAGDKGMTSSIEGPDENTKDDSEEILETISEIKGNPMGVSIGTFSGETDDGYVETQDVYIEVPNVSIETFDEQTEVVHVERDDAEKQDVYKKIDSHEMQTIMENTLQETPDSESKEVGDARMAEISERLKEVLSEERILIQPSSQEREMTEKQVQTKFIEDCEWNDEFSEASKFLNEKAANEHEVDDDYFKQKWELVEAPSKHVLTEAIEITDLECKMLKEELLSTLVGTGEGLSEELPNMLNQETVIELQYSSPVIDETSYIASIIDLETQVDISGPQLVEEREQVDIGGPQLVEEREQVDIGGSPVVEEREQVDYAKTLSVMKPKSIDPEPRRPSDTQNKPSNILSFGYNVEPEFKVMSSDHQEIGEPCLQLLGLHAEQGTRSIGDSSISLQSQRLDDPEPLQEETMTEKILDSRSSSFFSQVDQDESTQKVSLDEPDHYKLEIVPITLGGVRFASAHSTELSPKSDDLLPESIDTRNETRKESAQESVHQESTLGDSLPVIGFNQQSITTGTETAETTATNTDNIKLLRRQRSNTDPGLIHVQEEKFQASADSEKFSRGRSRSVTPPCDKFTSSYAPTSTKTLEHSPTSVLYPMMDENKNSHRVRDTAAQKHAMYPIQIMNPMHLLGYTQEESGFYQTEKFRQGSIESASQRPLPPLPQDTRVLRYTQNPERIVVQPKSSPKSTDGTSSIQPMPASLAAPVWLPPQRTQYPGGVNEMRPMKPPENPLVRRATIRHKRSNVGTKPMGKRFHNTSLPAIPQKDTLGGSGTSNLPKIQSVDVSKIQISSKNRPLPHQKMISEESGQPRSLSSMETLREEGHPALKEKRSKSPETVLLRGTRSKARPPPSDPSENIHRRYSTFINSSNLLYQEYSDVALNQEIQRQKPGDSPAEDSLPSSPRVRRRVLSSQDSYLQRLSVSSADSLWQDIPKIRDSVTFLSMTREEQKLQEAKFELIMSEALYLRSLNIAVDHFQRSTDLQEVMSAQDHQWLFSRLSEVRDASSDFLFDLEEEFESNMYNFQVCDLVISHEPNFRKVYRPYVTNQSYQDRTFQRLMNDTPRFQQVLAKLESDAVCQRLSLKSFLILPFQRITRMRLLLQNILKRSTPGSTEELQATEADNAIQKLIRDCNDGVQGMKDTEELILLNQKIQFECKIFPLISQSRRLVKHGEVMSMEYNPTSFKLKVTSRPIYLHLFNDCLLLSRVREGGRFVVFDHASDVRVERCEIKLHTNQKNVFRVFLRDSAALSRESSHDVREAEYMLRTETQSQKLRWICALSPPKEEIDFWKDHGLKQMQCLKSYKARENDELSLEKADILMITQDSDDGWLHGIRLSDQQSGWFPQSHVQTISRNACLRNLQEEQRLQIARAKLQPTGAKGH